MTTQSPTQPSTYRLPVIIQDLPNLSPDNGDWMSQKGRQIAIGSIPVAVLADLFEVDQNTPSNPDGYQRVTTTNRVNSLRRDLEARRVDLPTAILLNLRGFDISTHLNRLPDRAELVLTEGDKLYVVDGQHRVEALVRLYRDNDEDKQAWGERAIPFICLLGADRDGEMTEFYVVNSNAKSIGTGLAYELLKRRADNSEAVRIQLTETGRAWLRTAETLTQKLSDTNLWRGRIRFPGQKQQGTLITNNGMATSLRSLVEQPGYFQMIRDADEQVKVLDAYWEGIKLVVPETMSDPERFNIQRTLGVTALHSVLVNVLAIMDSRGLSKSDPYKFVEIIETTFKELSGLNPNGEWVQGADFWRRGSEGASGLFNNRNGHRVLRAQITEKLPPVIVD